MNGVEIKHPDRRNSAIIVNAKELLDHNKVTETAHAVTHEFGSHIDLAAQGVDVSDQHDMYGQIELEDGSLGYLEDSDAHAVLLQLLSALNPYNKYGSKWLKVELEYVEAKADYYRRLEEKKKEEEKKIKESLKNEK